MEDVTEDCAFLEKTMPADLRVYVRGMEEGPANALAQNILAGVSVLSRHFDLERLDGITVAADYADALATLDRGYETSRVLTPSNEFAYGIAMTPRVKRENVIKTHIVLNASVVLPFEDIDHEDFDEAFQILAHECAHVELSKVLDLAFPGVALSKAYEDILDAYKGEIILACWEEYGASRLSAPFGKDSLPGYAEILLLTLTDVRLKANECVRAYRKHGENDRILKELFGYYGSLLKYASYFLGHLDGAGMTIDDVPNVKLALEGHWFTPFFNTLHEALGLIFKEYGNWRDFSFFEKIGEIVIKVLREIGLTFYVTPEGAQGFRLPYTTDTMPHGFEWLAGSRL